MELNYPAGKIQVIVADDSTDDTRSVIDKKIDEVNSSGIVALVSRRSTREGFFFRTPKPGIEGGETNKQYFRDIHLDRVAIAEVTLSVLALGIGMLVLMRGVWILFISLAGFGILTLKSMKQSKVFGSKST